MLVYKEVVLLLYPCSSSMSGYCESIHHHRLYLQYTGMIYIHARVYSTFNAVDRTKTSHTL